MYINFLLQYGTVVNHTTDPREACAGAHVIVTDTWVSMGQEDEAKQRLKDFEGYQVNDKVRLNWKKCLKNRRVERVSVYQYSQYRFSL